MDLAPAVPRVERSTLRLQVKVSTDELPRLTEPTRHRKDGLSGLRLPWSTHGRQVSRAAHELSRGGRPRVTERASTLDSVAIT